MVFDLRKKVDVRMNSFTCSNQTDKLNTIGFVVKDDFLGNEKLDLYHNNAKELFENGKLKQANMGATTENQWHDFIIFLSILNS